MFNANKPRLSDLPTTGQLLRSTGIAAVVAGAILVTVVLPAEYGVDPTRIGSVFGLTEMGQLKRQLALEAEADAAAQAEARIVRAYRLGERDLSDMLLGRRQMHEAQRFELVARAEANAALLKLALDAHELWLRD